MRIQILVALQLEGLLEGHSSIQLQLDVVGARIRQFVLVHQLIGHNLHILSSKDRHASMEGVVLDLIHCHNINHLIHEISEEKHVLFRNNWKGAIVDIAVSPVAY